MENPKIQKKYMANGIHKKCQNDQFRTKSKLADEVRFPSE